MEVHTLDTQDLGHDGARRPGDTRPLWDAASGRFHPTRLRAAMVARGWTVGDFAIASGVSRACLYNSLRGRAVGDRTAVRIGTALATREPLSLLAGE